MIRLIEPADRAAWEPLWKAYQVFYKADLPAAVTESTWRRINDPAEPVWGALAVHEGRAVGLVHWLAHRSTWSVSDFCYLNDLFVDDAVRGKGFGRALIEHVYADAREKGCAKVYWLTHETNATAQRLYNEVAEKTGFIQYRKLL